MSRPVGQSSVPLWAAGTVGERFSWSDAVGGWRGGAESTTPGLVFVILFVLTRDLRTCLFASASVAVVFCVLRLVQRQRLTQALSGLMGVGIGVAWAALSGRGENYFAWGLVTASFFALVLLVTIAIRRPAVGEMLALVWELPGDWRTAPGLSALRRRCLTLTWMWTGLFVVRLGIQWPLWQVGAVAQLGIAKLVLGVPLFAAACWLTWTGLRSFTPLARAGAAQDHNDEVAGSDICE